MKTIHADIENYSARCDALLLNKHFKALLDEAAEHIIQIEVAELYDTAHDLILLDVREPEEFASGYIDAKEVLAIPRGKLEFMAIDKIAKVYGQDIKIVTYCLKGPRGLLAAYQLKKLGFTNVVNLKGGILNWLHSGNTIHNYLGRLSLA